MYQGENTSKAFAIDEKTTISTLHRFMVQKLELSESEGKFFEVVEKWGDEGKIVKTKTLIFTSLEEAEAKLDVNENVNTILARWEKDKKKKKKEPAFWWRENEDKQKQVKRDFYSQKLIVVRENAVLEFTLEIIRSKLLQLMEKLQPYNYTKWL